MIVYPYVQNSHPVLRFYCMTIIVATSSGHTLIGNSALGHIRSITRIHADGARRHDQAGLLRRTGHRHRGASANGGLTGPQQRGRRSFAPRSPRPRPRANAAHARHFRPVTQRLAVSVEPTRHSVRPPDAPSQLNHERVIGGRCAPIRTTITHGGQGHDDTAHARLGLCSVIWFCWPSVPDT